MSKPPVAMRTNKRPVDPHFHPDECLFRRVPIWMWNDPAERPGPDAVDLPDMSVGRSKYGHAEWVRFDVVNDRHFADWGVLFVRVSDIPPKIWELGVYRYTFTATHQPLDDDYPHSEVRAHVN